MRVEQFKSIVLKESGTFVTVTPDEALGLIKSLTHQLYFRSSNSERMESYDQNGRFFTIAVEEVNQ